MEKHRARTACGLKGVPALERRLRDNVHPDKDMRGILKHTGADHEPEIPSPCLLLQDSRQEMKLQALTLRARGVRKIRSHYTDGGATAQILSPTLTAPSRLPRGYGVHYEAASCRACTNKGSPGNKSEETPLQLTRWKTSEETPPALKQNERRGSTSWYMHVSVQTICDRSSTI